jgi:hypothetical protein
MKHFVSNASFIFSEALYIWFHLDEILSSLFINYLPCHKKSIYQKILYDSLFNKNETQLR